ncbi:MAG: flavodoxin family protein [Nitrospirae bacterium]|nr:flavodoxin family protein [Nitrospirota bacterium]
MKALVLDGSLEKERELLAARTAAEYRLKDNGWDINSVILKDIRMAPCRGCFGCWTKTPGTCVIDDPGREITRLMVQSDLLVLVTPVKFGSYSSLLKRAIERFIPILLPFFRSIDGVVHHQLRYDHYPRLLVIGYQREPDQKTAEIFRRLVHGNVINGLGSSYEIALFHQGQSESDILTAVAAAMNDMRPDHA